MSIPPRKDKENEITAIPTLQELIDLKGASVSINAISSLRESARHMIDAGADYVLAVTENQKTLHRAKSRKLCA
jgi:predicted transposase YbfD/YdcC